MSNYVASHLKDMNRITVYRLFTQNDEVFRGSIARETGISAPTVLKIVNFMIENDLVLELGAREGSVGRKPQMLTLNPNAFYTIGIIFEGGYIRAGLMNFSSELLHLITIPADSNFCGDARSRIPQVIETLVAETGIDAAKLKGIGIGIPGPYDSNTNTISYAPLVGIHNPENLDWLVEWLVRTYHVHVAINNDVNMSVIGEYHARKMVDDDLIYINVGTGLGAGLILDGKLRSGRNFQCGEIGYMTFSARDGYRAEREKPGWLEAKTNLHAIRQLFGHEAAVPQGDNSQIIAHLAEYLALCINNMTAVIDCRNVAVGGIVLEMLGDALIAAIENKLRDLSITEVAVTAAKSIGAGVQGACCEVMERVVTELLAQ